MSDFCKLFNSDKYGQILVIADTNSEGHPSVCVKLVPEGMGICSPEYSFTNEDESVAWDKVDKLFESFDLAMAEKIAEEICDVCTNF